MPFKAVVRTVATHIFLLMVLGYAACHTYRAAAGVVTFKQHYAEITQGDIRSDDDYYRHKWVLGDDFKLLAELRNNCPQGRPITLQMDRYRAHPARTQHLWLALLPRYPFVPNNPLVICAKESVRPGDRVLAMGDMHVLVLRQWPGRS